MLKCAIFFQRSRQCQCRLARENYTTISRFVRFMYTMMRAMAIANHINAYALYVHICQPKGVISVIL